MTQICLTRTITAPVDVVFRTIADIREFSKVIPEITNVEFLSAQQIGVGTRFRETRLMKGREMHTVLDVTEYVENDRIRMVADSHGTVWDTLFTVTSDQENSTTLQMVMNANSYKLFSRLMNWLMKGLIAKLVANDLDRVKTFCENPSAIDNSE